MGARLSSRLSLRTVASADEHFFRFTSGRWIHDEEKQLAMRYRQFNVDALKQAVLACTGAQRVLDMSKLAEGRDNKVFRMRLAGSHSGISQVIARIPTPLAGPSHEVTASEVATMDFLRNTLGLKQVPRVLASCSRAEDSPVGAEYIIMDVADGVELREVWHDLGIKKLRVVNEWIKFESVVLDAFSATAGFGSLYRRQDVPSNKAQDIWLDGVKNDHFVVGPSVQEHLLDERYTNLDGVDRGPWPNVLEYLNGLTANERRYIEQLTSPKKKVTPFDTPNHLQQSAAHLRLLDQWSAIAKFFVPADERLLKPTIMLRDSHASNIFLSREALNEGKISISAVIDWQHTAVLPLYLQSQIPLFIECAEPGPGQSDEDFARHQAHLYKAYHALYQDTGRNVAWASSLAFGGKRTMAQDMPMLASCCWEFGYPYLKRKLIKTWKEWDEHQIAGPNVPCPLDFSAEKVEQSEQDELDMREVRKTRNSLISELGVDEEGYVEAENYDHAVQLNKRRRDEWLATLSDAERQSAGEHWPYRPGI